MNIDKNSANEKNTELKQSLDNFMANWVAHQQGQGIALEIEQDEQWPSDAIINDDTQRQISIWKPVLQTENNSFDALREGLEIDVNQQLESYYSRYWSDNLNASTDRGGLQLLFAWNQDDFVRLQENLIAHVLMKRRLRQRDTLFFAVTDEEDFVLSILNETGEVVLERVGKEPKEVLAPDLNSFLQALQPQNY